MQDAGSSAVRAVGDREHVAASPALQWSHSRLCDVGYNAWVGGFHLCFLAPHRLARYQRVDVALRRGRSVPAGMVIYAASFAFST